MITVDFSYLTWWQWCVVGIILWLMIGFVIFLLTASNGDDIDE